MTKFLVAVLISVPSLTAAASATGLPINDKLLLQRWSARWITHAAGPHRDFGVFHFRKSFTLDAVPSQFIVHVSADNRYRLYINGVSISIGPARSDLDHWRYETVDLAPHLRRGDNLLAAMVWNYGVHAPMAQFSHRTAFLLQGNTETEEIANTPRGWKSYHNPAYEPISMRPHVPYFYVVGPGERFDASAHPWGWETQSFDDSGWAPVASVGGAQPMELFQWNVSRWLLTPRPIPPMEETPERLERVVRSAGLEASSEFVRGSVPISVPANSKASVLLDRGHLTTAYPELTVDGGQGSQITIHYAESTRYPNGRKGNRNEVAGKRISRNNFDVFLPDGERRALRTLFWRTYRYIRLDIETRDEPLSLVDFRGEYSSYPVERRAVFESPDEELQQIVDVGWRTQRVCTNETYFDTPQYEQLAYAGDGRLQALITLVNMWDDRIVRNHIEQFWYSARPEGMIQDRYPSVEPQYIPSYGLDWISSLHDFYMYRDDPEFLRKFIPVSRDILDWYLRRLDNNGVLRTLSWTDENYNGPLRFHENVPDARNQLELILTLDKAAQLEEALGDPGRAERYRILIPRLKHAAFDAFWVAERGLLARNRDRKDFSQHTNVLGILADVIPPDKQRAALEYTIEHWDDLPRVRQAKSGFFFFYFRHQAMAKVGMGNQFLSVLDHYREQLANGFTTWGESVGLNSRSDSHSWSSGPNVQVHTLICGVKPAAPGYREVRIQPHLNGLSWARCVVPHPKGQIKVDLKASGEDGLEATVELPAGITGWFELDGRKVSLAGGSQQLEF